MLKTGSRHLRFLAVLSVVVALLGSSAAPIAATHVAGHGHAVAKETTGDGFTGVHVYRVDQAVAGQPSTGCSSPFTGKPVYQTQLVIITADAKNWRELGTGHQCNDSYRYWFWGYGSNGTWVPLGTQSGITNGQWHFFKIERVFEDTFNRYKFRIDGVIKAVMTSNATGPSVEAGLESYADTATVAGHNYTTLQYQKNNGSFFNWVGQDASVVNPPLCGFWVAAISWRAGEGAGQC